MIVMLECLNDTGCIRGVGRNIIVIDPVYVGVQGSCLFLGECHSPLSKKIPSH